MQEQTYTSTLAELPSSSYDEPCELFDKSVEPMELEDDPTAEASAKGKVVNICLHTVDQGIFDHGWNKETFSV